MLKKGSVLNLLVIFLGIVYTRVILIVTSL